MTSMTLPRGYRKSTPQRDSSLGLLGRLLCFCASVVLWVLSARLCNLRMGDGRDRDLNCAASAPGAMPTVSVGRLRGLQQLWRLLRRKRLKEERGREKRDWGEAVAWMDGPAFASKYLEKCWQRTPPGRHTVGARSQLTLMTFFHDPMILHSLSPRVPGSRRYSCLPSSLSGT